MAEESPQEPVPDPLPETSTEPSPTPAPQLTTNNEPPTNSPLPEPVPPHPSPPAPTATEEPPTVPPPESLPPQDPEPISPHPSTPPPPANHQPPTNSPLPPHPSPSKPEHHVEPKPQKGASAPPPANHQPSANSPLPPHPSPPKPEPTPQVSDIKPQVSDADIVQSLTDEQLKLASSLYAKKHQKALSRKGVEARQAIAQKNIASIRSFIAHHSQRTIAPLHVLSTSHPAEYNITCNSLPMRGLLWLRVGGFRGNIRLNKRLFCL
jgi:hypothetical protein